MVYLVPIFLCLLFSLQYDRTNGLCILGESKYSKRKYNLIFIWLVVISALQYCVGYDIPIYMNAYETNKNISINDIWGDARYRPGWLMLQVICHKVSDDFVFLKIIQALFLNFCVYRFLTRYSKYWYLTLFFYILYSYGQLNFGAMRQSFAVGFFLLAIPYLEDKKSSKDTVVALIKYFVFVYMSTMFHTSAFILFLVPLLKFCVVSAKRISITIVIVIIASVVVSQMPNINILLFNLIDFSDDIAKNAEYYLTVGDYVGTKAGFGLVFAFIPISFIYLCLYLTRHNNDSRYKVMKMLLLAYIVMATLNISVPIFYRFNDYFMFSYIILMPSAIYEGGLTNPFLRSSLAKILLFFLYILAPVNHLVAVHPAFGFPGYRIYYPYHSVLDPQIDSERMKVIQY